MNRPPAKAAADLEAGTWTDLSLGSSQLGIRPAVFIESRILRDYSELHPDLGLNAAGVTLSVLWARLAVNAAIRQDNRLTVCLLRREDGRPAEVQLRAEPGRVNGRACLFLLLAGPT